MSRLSEKGKTDTTKDGPPSKAQIEVRVTGASSSTPSSTIFKKIYCPFTIDEIRLQYPIYYVTYQKTHSPLRTTPVPTLKSTPKSTPAKTPSQSPHKSKRFHSPSTDTSSEIRKEIKIPYQLGEDVFRVSDEHAAKALSTESKSVRTEMPFKHATNKWEVEKLPKCKEGTYGGVQSRTGTQQIWEMMEQVNRVLKLIPPAAYMFNE